MKEFTIIFDKLAMVTVNANDLNEATQIAEEMLEIEDDLDWTEAGIKEIETEE